MSGENASLMREPEPETEAVASNVVALPAPPPEAAAIRAALAGDGRAFAALVRPHLAALYRIAGRACGRPALAEDAVQETLDIAYRNLGRYRPGTSLRAFLAAIAVRRAHTLLRAERRRLQREERGPRPATSATPEEHLAAAETQAQVASALARMPERRRTAALLRLDAGLAYSEIAAAMNSTPGAAKALVHLATSDLRRALSAALSEDGA